uniref:RING-type domain-containing protein n=1 Tax=viral metagenome TaxID=1070528 RepID=A0A6C0CKI5_9ZZZZ
MPGEKLPIIPSEDDVCLICQESSGIRLDKCTDYKCQCRGMFFHEPCYDPFKGSPCPICRNPQIRINVEVPVEIHAGIQVEIQAGMVDIQRRLRQMNEEQRQLRETKITLYMIGPLFIAAYITTIVYAILACSEWQTYSDFQRVTLVALIVTNVYLIFQIMYTIAKPERWLLHSKSKLNTFLQVIILCVAVISMFVYFQDPEVYNLKVATGITAIITICSIGIVFVLVFVVGMMAACEYMFQI